jgi:hypothetical protein
MKEIEKLKLRLKNIHPKVTECTMSVIEIRKLIQEFEELESKAPEPPVKFEPVRVYKVMDGGTF